MKDLTNILVIFDLDYTIIDNSEGIVNSFNFALKEHNIPELDSQRIKKMVGTPLTKMFAQVTDIQPSKLTSAFRNYYRERGIYQVKFLAYTKKKVKNLSKSFKLGVITSKKEEMAQKIVKIIGLERYFDFVLGETQMRRKKAHDSVLDFLEKNYPDYEYLVVGDHIHDRELAELIDGVFIGVLTGFHTREQLLQEHNGKGIILQDLSKLSIQLIQDLVEK
ncbi:MAG: HAD family hydrolase [Promethearchaeia archaeon]